MKMNFLKLTALAAAMALGAAACSGCGRMKEDGATLELNMDNSWRSEKTLTGVSHSAMFSVGKNMLCYKEKTNGEQEFVRYELETGHYERFFSKTSETLEGVDRIQCVPIRLPDGNVGSSIWFTEVWAAE